MEFSGRLASFPIPELLQWAHNDRRTGSLVVRRSSRQKRIYFDEGRIVACLTDQPAEFFGQHLLLSGLIDHEALLRCLARCRMESKRLGLVLEEQGILTRKQVERALKNHIEDVICDIFLWHHGVFFFRSEAPPREEILAESIDTVGIAFEGARWSDEFRRIRNVFEHDEMILSRRDRPIVEDEIEKLGWRGRRIHAEVDGQKTLEAVYRKVNGSYFRFLSTAFEMHQGGYFEVENQEESGITSVELSIHDVIFEQAATEQMRGVKRHISSPLAAFERFVPVWARYPAEKEWERMPEAVRTFYLCFDGTKRLVDILSKDEEEWGRQAELLMLLIAKEAVALLPMTIAELEANAEEKGTPDEERWWKNFAAQLYDEGRPGP